MKKYALKHKNGEVINTISAFNLIEASEKFAMLKLITSKQLLELAFEMGIKITFGSDAHNVEQIGFMYDNAVTLAKDIVYKECVSFAKRDKRIIVI